MDKAYLLVIVIFLVWWSRYLEGSLTSLIISDPRSPNGYENMSRVSLIQGMPTTFTCTLLVSNTSFTIKWYINNKVLTPEQDQSTPTPDPSGLLTITSTYILTATRAEHNNNLKCVATSNGHEESTSVLILVEGPPDNPVIQGDADITEGQIVSFVCISTGGYPAPTVQWRYLNEDGIDLTPQTPEETNTTDWRYRVQSTLELTPGRKDNQRRLQCVTNHKTLNQPLISELTLNVKFCPDTVTLQCPTPIENGTEREFICESSEGNPAPNLIWMLNNTNIDQDEISSKREEGAQFGGFREIDTYTTLVTREFHRKNLECMSTRRRSKGLDCEVIDDCVISVLYQPIIQALDTASAKEGESHTVVCSVDANPSAAITWSKLNKVQVNGQTLAFQQISREDAGSYSCQATNGIGESTEDVDLYVDFSPTTTFRTENITNVMEGENITISCEVEAYPSCVVRWYNPNNTRILENERMKLEESVASEDRFRPRIQSNLLIIGATVSEDDGFFRCEATNSLGAENIMFKVSVEAYAENTSRVVVAVVLLMVTSIVIATLAIVFVRRKRRKYSTSRNERGISRQVAQNQSSVVAELAERQGAMNTYSVDPHPLSSSAFDTEELRPNKVDSDTTYANITANFTFPRENIQIIKDLGQGAFGKVLLAKAKGIMGVHGETEVAIKTLKEDAHASDKEDLLRELELMKILKPHPNVVRLLGCCTDTDPIYVIVEYMSNGNLKSFLRTSRSKNKNAIYDNLHGISASLTLRQLIKFAKQIANGMEYLSSQKCVHRDLAARNVLVSDDLTCKVSDFGLARDVMNVRVYQRQREEFRLPLRWMALESLVEDVFTTESDIWSFGILLWEIITLGARPYPGTDTKDIVSGLKCGMRMPCPKHCPPEIYKIMQECWQANPKDRPSFILIDEMLQELLKMDSMHIAMNQPEESLYALTEISLANEKL